VGVAENSDDESIQESMSQLSPSKATQSSFILLVQPSVLNSTRMRACAMQWSEDVVLLREEMRRVLEVLEWHSVWWEGQQTWRGNLNTELNEGMVAYASKQATVRRLIRKSFNHLWRDCDKFISLGHGADNNILNFQDAASHRILDMPLLG
jgi:hypothetical protein